MTSPARHVVAVASGKGGVGKSTVALNLALALQADGARVGILDADVYGPDIPLMVNLTRKVSMSHWTLARASDAPKLEPVEALGLKIMSTGFIIGESAAFTWSSPLVSRLAHQLFHEVAWGELDYLFVDLPPGTADLQQQFASTFELSGVVIVVTPPDVAHLDAKKAVTMFREKGVRILGGVENMSGMLCPHCGEHVDVLPRVPKERSVWSDGVEWLGSIPMDPAVGLGGNAGKPVVIAAPDSEPAKAFRIVAGAIASALG